MCVRRLAAGTSHAFVGRWYQRNTAWDELEGEVRLCFEFEEKEYLTESCSATVLQLPLGLLLLVKSDYQNPCLRIHFALCVEN